MLLSLCVGFLTVHFEASCVPLKYSFVPGFVSLGLLYHNLVLTFLDFVLLFGFLGASLKFSLGTAVTSVKCREVKL